MASVCGKILRKYLESFLCIISPFALLKKLFFLLFLFPFRAVFIFRDLSNILCDQFEMYPFRLSCYKGNFWKVDYVYKTKTTGRVGFISLGESG